MTILSNSERLLKGKSNSSKFIRKGRLYLVFEFVGKSLLDVLEDSPTGLDVSL
jgi:hypothetical protein